MPLLSSPRVCAWSPARARVNGAAVSICLHVDTHVHGFRVASLNVYVFKDFVTQSLRPRAGGEQKVPLGGQRAGAESRSRSREAPQTRRRNAEPLRNLCG